MKWVAVGLCVVLACLATGCATPYPSGAAYMKVKLPVDVNGNKMPTGLKTGTAMCKSYCGMVALGDVSIDTAAKNGGITQIHYVDWDVESYAGIYATYKVTVYGE